MGQKWAVITGFQRSPASSGAEWRGSESCFKASGSARFGGLERFERLAAIWSEVISEIVAAVRFDAEGDIHARSAPSDNRMSPARVRSLWRRKRQLGMPASPNRAALRALLSERPTAQARVRRSRP